MRLLMLTPRLPYPPDRGDTLRSWHILRGLAPRHEVWLASLTDGEPPPDHLERVRSLCRQLEVFPRSPGQALRRGALRLLSGGSVTEGYFSDPRLTECLRAWATTGTFDALLTYSSGLARLSGLVPARRRVLDLCDVDSAKWDRYARRSWPPLSWLYRHEARRVRTLEAQGCRGHHLCLVVNERERRKLRHGVPDATAAVLPTAIDVSEFADLPVDPAPEPLVGLLGSMFYPPNVRAVHWFGSHVWPRVLAQVPQVRWLIVGSRPTRDVRSWENCPGVTVTGYVPDIKPVLATLRVFINPVDGDLGLQSKVVVAMAAARPAVVTPDTAAGLVYSDPPPFLIAASPETFAASVVRLLRDDAQARALAARARATAWQNYHAPQQVKRLEAWLAGVMARDRTLPAAAVGAVARDEAEGALPE